MTRLFGTFALVLWAAVAGAQDHTQLVSDIQGALAAKGVAIHTVEGAFEVAKRVAWTLRTEGCGLLLKPGGENIVSWQGRSFSAGRVCFAGGHLIKIFTDVPTTNGPTWADNGMIDPAMCVPAMDPDDPITPPVVTPPSPPPSAPPPVVDDFAARVYAKLAELATKADVDNIKQTVTNEAVATRGQEQANADAIRADVKHWWKDAAMFFLEKILPPALAAFGGWKLAK